MQAQMVTNATNTVLASTLAGIGTDTLGNGTLVLLTVRKKGVTRGAGDKKLVYGDDTVQVLLWAGFTYKALVERSYKKLHEMWQGGTLFRDLQKAAIDAGCHDVTLADVAEGAQEVEAGLLRIINAHDKEGLDPATDDAFGDGGFAPSSFGGGASDVVPTWEQLVVNGVPVVGAKVYIGANKALTAGTVYMDGVKLGERVLVPAANGAWAPKQRTKTVVKDLLRDKLPVGLYARYALTPENLQDVKVGGTAATAAKAGGIVIDPTAIRSLFKLAA